MLYYYSFYLILVFSLDIDIGYNNGTERRDIYFILETKICDYLSFLDSFIFVYYNYSVNILFLFFNDYIYIFNDFSIAFLDVSIVYIFYFNLLI